MRAVFKTFGSLICWRLENEWAPNNRVVNTIEKALLPALVNASEQGADPTRTWRRWRSYHNKDSNFAGGRLDSALDLIQHAKKLRLLDRDLAERCKHFIELLEALGKGSFSYDSSDLDHGIDMGYEVISDLADIDPLAFKGEFFDRLTGKTFKAKSFPPRAKISNDDFRMLAVDAALAALRALKCLELAIGEANSVLDGRRIQASVDPAMVRELVLGKYRQEVTELVANLHESLKRTFKPSAYAASVSAITEKYVKEMTLTMIEQAKEKRST